MEFLQQEGQTGFIGFSNLSGNSLGYVPQPKSDESELDADLRLLLRKMTKKDTITRLKVFFWNCPYVGGSNENIEADY